MAPRGSRARRRRDRVFPGVTLAVAAAWCGASWYVGGEVGRANLARGLVALYTGGMAAPQTGPSSQPESSSDTIPDPSSGPATPMPSLFSLPPVGADAERPEWLTDLPGQVVRGDVMIQAWRVGMYVVGAFLAAMAGVSLWTGRPRWPHLIAAGLILASTGGTLVAIHFLADPDVGGLPPLYRSWTMSAAGIQSAYGVVLLIAFARKRRP